MRRARLLPTLLVFLACSGGTGAARAAAGGGAGQGSRWALDAACGFDSFTHTYSLATADTSETVSEARAVLGWEGRSHAGARSAWRARLEASAGTDLWRERLELDWRRRDDRGVDRWRASARAAARQYRPGSDYTRSSDQAEARLDAQGVAWAGGAREAFVAAWGAATDYATSSALEQDQREAGLGAGLRSRGLATSAWRLAVKHAARSYPDSAAIDRRAWSGEAEWSGTLGLAGLARAYARSERRLAADPGVRPDAWLHWLDTALEAPVPGGDLVLEFQGERWDYGGQSETWQDNWRLAGFAGLRRGDVLAGRWQLGVTGERFASLNGAESYAQAGLRAGLESLGARLAGSCTVEYGRRDYGEQSGDEGQPAWTGFNYWRVWLLADWRLSGALTLSALGNWEPERHAEREDDVSLGFASLRLSWRR